MIGKLLAAGLLAGFAGLADQDPAAFTAEMVGRIAKVVGRPFEVAGPLEIRPKGAKKSDSTTIYLDRIYQFCATNGAEECEDVKERFAAGTAETFAELPPLTTELLRVVVRSADYCDQLGRLETSKAKSPLQNGFADGLCVMLMADYPRTRRTVSTKDLDSLKLGADDAWGIAQRQTLVVAPHPPETVQDRTLVMLRGGDYVPSVLLDAAGWRALAARTKGDLVVTVPDDGFVTVISNPDPETVKKLAELSRQNFDSAERGISPLLYRWNGNGWSAMR